MEKLVFNYSQESLKLKKWLISVMAFLMPALVFFFVAASNPLGPMSIASTLRMLLPALIVVFVFFGAASFFVGGMTLRRLRDLKIQLSPEGMERIGGPTKEYLNYSDIRRLVLVDHPRRGLLYMKLFSPKGAWFLSGFENMEQLGKELRARLGEGISIEQRHQRIRWESPGWVLAVTLTVATFFLALTRLHPMLTRDFPKIFNLAFALYLIFYRPLSKAQGIRFRKWEWVLGVIILFFTAISLGLRVAFSA